MSNWSRALAIPFNEWNFETSCCRNAIVYLRAIEAANLIATSFVAMVFIRILSNAKNIHVNLRILFSVSVLNDFFLLTIRIVDFFNVSGLLVENDVYAFFKYNFVLILTIVSERIYSVWAYNTYDDLRDSVPNGESQNRNYIRTLTRRLHQTL
ncbi:hypothetical protein PENTCL1PPCAC_12687 [Pristionchus entomophagus]|uniref:G protein-coupled receptor n=1 Tax=Pristionchus entomophagus TaxID=358040 RepID=A0AAV5T7Y6_9BILA|nr:hypothetical protein PENTCL1PPCAC_12687 [Pristionchus entomophagus]